MEDWINFARSGAVIVIIGALVTAWDWLRAGNNLVPLLRHAPSRERMPPETLGLCLIVLSTLIWAFGDLAGRLAPRSARRQARYRNRGLGARLRTGRA
jgi:drug/metabolite transporter (DMT)-like permease